MENGSADIVQAFENACRCLLSLSFGVDPAMARFCMLLALMMQLLTCRGTQQAMVPLTTVGLIFEEIAARRLPTRHSQPSLNCTWRLPDAPKTFYTPEWCVKQHPVMKMHVEKFLPAGGFTRVEKPGKALFIVTAGFFHQITRGIRLCQQQLVQGLPFHPDKWLDYAGLQRLGTRYPWTHAKDFLALTYALGNASACEEWTKSVQDQYQHGPSAPQTRNAPAWVLKKARGHLGKNIKFLPWDFVKKRNISKICEQHRGYVVQQMIHSTTVFRGGSVFSLRVHFLVTSFSPMKAVWQKRRAAYQFFAERPGHGSATDGGKYVTNQQARIGDLDAYTGVAATAFDQLKAGMWEECIAPQLKVALVAYMLYMQLTLSERPPNLFNLFGCDFLVEKSFRVRFLECNKYPAYTPVFGDLFDEVYPFVLQEAVHRSSQPGSMPRTLQQNFEVLLDETTRYVFTSPEPHARCSVPHTG